MPNITNKAANPSRIYQISDRYTQPSGQAFLTGVQALARIPIQQLWADRANGLNTAAFISGYQGSPLGGFDQEVARAAKFVPDLPIVVEPAVNEELGATAVMGSQLVSEQPDCQYDGVLGLWYGKAPGLDRAGDALRHAVFAGTSYYGGAVALVGDDPAAKSSTLPSSSDATLVDLHMPMLYPGDVQEVLDLGRHAVAMSRATGVWTAMKIVASVADGSGTVDLSPRHGQPTVTSITIGPDGSGDPYVHHPSGQLLTPHTLDLEREFREVRSGLVLRYAVENKLNHTTANPSDAWIGIISSGYTYHELIESLRRLGLETIEQIEAAGIRLFQMTMPVPFDKANMRTFARGLDEILIVEEKNPTLEWLVKDALYGGPDQPRVLGKHHPDGRTLMRSYSILDADSMIDGLRERLSLRIADRLAPPPQPERARTLIPLEVSRSPYFCSGCPHNWGTKNPEGSLIGAGIGCHTMIMLIDDPKVGDIAGLTAMGGEGAQWIGMSPFIDRDHFIQNLGDGTFFHSGQLAIQAAIAAKVNITYKLLYNATVAMTGGQDAIGGVGVPEIATILLAHGASDVRITTDDVSAYKGIKLPHGPNGTIKVWDRTRIVEAQEELANVEGVTVIIHDQACAAQNRRLRKRNKVATPSERVVINHRICEACGDCGEVSNCLSVQAIETPLGRKTTIDQDSCNLDFSCIGGDCPSFMTVEPADDPVKQDTTKPASLDGEIPDPASMFSSDDLSLRMAGIGGTGVVTVAQILSTAAMLDGWHVRGLDQIGLSQKAGPVVSDIRMSRHQIPVSNLIGEGEANAILAFDLLVGADVKTLSVASGINGEGGTRFIGSTTPTPTGAMIGHPETEYPTIDQLINRIGDSTGETDNRFVDAGAITEGLLGNRASSNVFMLGVAIQAGMIPVTPEALKQAIELNGVAVQANKEAFGWGRRWALNPAEVEASAGIVDPSSAPTRSSPVEVTEKPLPATIANRITGLLGAAQSDTESANLTSLLSLLASDLVDYQDENYANRFLDTVGLAKAAEVKTGLSNTGFTEAVARGLHKLMAYKDEYEVARLLLLPESQGAAEAVAGPGAKITWRLDPPIFKTLDQVTSRLRHPFRRDRQDEDSSFQTTSSSGSSKIKVPTSVGVPMMQALVKMKHLRGTKKDPFGRAEVRRVERVLITEYEKAIGSILPHVTKETIAQATSIAGLAMDVRGFEHLKLERAAIMRAALAKQTTAFVQ